MACDIRGGCKVCPGMWIAAGLLIAMLLQNLFFRAAPASSAQPEPREAGEPTSLGGLGLDSLESNQSSTPSLL